MNDLFFIDYQPRIMIADTMDMRPDTELAHRRLCDSIWSNDVCPRNDDLILQDLCRVKPQDWARVKGELVVKGWIVEGGRFVHRGTVKTLNACKSRHKAKVRSAKTASAARWSSGRDANAMRTQSDRNASAKRPQCQSQSQSQSQSTSSLNISLESKNPPKGQSSNFRALKIANRIISNQDSWHWENCKVPIGGLKSRSLATVIEPHLDNTRLIAEWQSAVREAHGAVVDGLPKAKRNPVGYCIACFKARVSV